MLRYRAVFRLLPEACLYLEPPEAKPVIRQHLTNLGLEPHESLVSAIKFFCDQFRASRSGRKRKPGITDVYTRYPHLFRKISGEQNNRCAYCGIRIQYGGDMQLDHIIPWYLGDDPPDGRNWQFTCGPCNLGKSMWPYYSLSRCGSNWIGPDSEPALSLDVRFAVLARDGACVKTGLLPTQGELTVEKVVTSGCWVLDNAQAVAAI